jgi:hypothetical protein
MGRISFDDLDNYGSSGSYFQLKDNGDKANVRFLYNTIDDITPYVVHSIPDGYYKNGNEKTAYVNCLRNYNEPADKCPFCKAGMPVQPKLMLKVYNEDAKECQIWERGKTYASRMANLASHFNPLVDEVIEITRCGAKGDNQTTYEFMPVGNSHVNLDDFDCVEPLGFNILDKTADDMEAYLNLGAFPGDSANVSQQRNNNNQYNGNVVRRTPPTNSRAF